jgi:hypothetical protein
MFLAKRVQRMVSPLVIVGDQFADWKFQHPHKAVARPDRYTLRQPRPLSNSRTRIAQRNWPPARSLG